MEKISLDSSGLLRLVLIVSLFGIQVANLAGLAPPVQASTISFVSNLNLSNDNFTSGSPVIATSGKYAYVAWLNSSCVDCKSDVLFKASSSNGTGFTASIPFRLSTTVNGDASNVQIAAVGSYVYVAWQNNVSLTSSDVFLRRSNDNGATFQAAVDLSAGISNAVDSQYPSLAASGNNVTVAWFLQTSSHNNPNTIVAKAGINNNGATFTSAFSITNNADPNYGPEIAQVGKYVYATWREAGRTYFASSSNGGSSFGAGSNIAGSVTGESDLYQAITAVGTNVYVTWTNDTNTSSCPVTCDNTMFRANTNNGASANWGPVMNLYTINGTPNLNPVIAASGNSVYVAWTNATGGSVQILFRASTNQGGSFGPIKNLSSAPVTSNQQVIAASGTNVYVAWAQSNASNEVYFASSSDNGATFGSPQNLSPTLGNGLSPLPAIGTSGPNVYVAWQDDTAGNGDILFRGNAKIKGDVNGDCKVDIVDLSTVGSVFGKSLGQPGWIPTADLNNDGTINIVDLVIVASSFGQSC